MKHTETVIALPVLMSAKSFYNIPAYQRDNDAWSLSDQQLLMDSLLRSYAIPKIYVRPQGARKELLDGQQRCTAIKGYLNDKFPLAKDMPPVETDGQKVECAGLLYSELPEILQAVLNESTLVMVKIEEASNTDVRDYFLRLQKGSPLNPAEKRRALGGNLPKLVKQLTKHDFWNHVGYASKRLAHETSATQMLLLALEQAPCKLGAAELASVYVDHAKMKAEDDVVVQTEAVLNTMAEMFDHLEEACKQLKKTTVPALFGAIYQLQEMEGKKLDTGKLYSWFEDFNAQLKDGDLPDYTDAVSKSVDSKESLEVRINTLVTGITKVGA